MNRIIFLISITFIFAQDIKTDSLGLATDSIKVKKERPVSATPYFGETVSFYRNDSNQAISEYVNKAKIVYEDMQIEAYRIIVNHETNKLVAYPKVDTLEDGKLNYEQMPVFFQEGNAPMYGEKMEYDFTTKRGRVYSGKTEMKPSKYEGDYIKKIGNNTIFIRFRWGLLKCISTISPPRRILARRLRRMSN